MHQGEFLDDLYIDFKDRLFFYLQVEVKQSHFSKSDFERFLQICHFHLRKFRNLKNSV